MSSKETSTPAASPSLKRRSARVHKRDPIVAPGFGTYKDLVSLSENLGLPVPAVKAIMESRGRGIRGSKSAEEKEPPTPISHAWSDFMMEEMGTLAATTDETSPAAAAATNEAAADAKKSASTTETATDKPREYKLPIVPAWKKDEEEPRPKKAKKDAGHVLVQTGTLDSTMIGRNKRALDRPYDLTVPTVLMPSLKITKVIASCNAAHAICLDAQGQAYGWGRNEALQLSQSLPEGTVPLPTKLDLSCGTIVDGAVGKSHSILLNIKGELYAVGSNKVGQCGIRSSIESVPNFRKCPLEGVEVVQISCGEQFSVALSDQGRMYTTGSSEFGQLGNGETGEYFVTANKIAFANCNEFTLRNKFCHAPGEHGNITSDIKVIPMDEKDIRIGYIACGKHHTVAVEAASGKPPRVFSWGCGNYGCLGHGVQADEFFPRLVTTLSTGPLWEANPPVAAAAGASCTLIRTERGHVYYCGKHRSVGEAVMRPHLLEALANNGHVVNHMSAGSQSVVCSTANAVTVSWGQGAHGELGYGEKKSSAKPQFVAALDKCRIRDLACGQGTTLFLVTKEDKDDDEAIKQLNVFDVKDAADLE